jgi:hypothetical protein
MPCGAPVGMRADDMVAALPKSELGFAPYFIGLAIIFLPMEPGSSRPGSLH